MLVTKPSTSHSSLRPLGWCFVVLCVSLSIGCGGGGGGGATASSGDGSSALENQTSISTPAGIETTLPLGHKLYQDTVAKVLSVPDKETLTSLFF